MMKKLIFAIFILLAAVVSHVAGQVPAPKHTRLLFSHPLTSDGTTEYGLLKNIKGTFRADGWEAGPQVYADCSLRLYLHNHLPARGTIEITIRNFEPYSQSSQSKHHILSITSQDSVAEQIFYNGGSWCYLRFGQLFNTPPNKAGIKFDAGSIDKSTRQEPYILMDKVWNINATYKFELVWTQEYIWLLINGTQVHVQEFPGQIERFKYIFIGDDDNYKSMFGPIYSNLKIYTEDTPVTFSDRTVSLGLSGVPSHGGYGLTSADFNNDGRLDFYIGNQKASKCLSDILYLHQANATFLDEAPGRGVEDRCGSYAVVAADVDNDGDLDLVNANHEAPNRLYINDGSGYFTNESSERGLQAINATTVGAIALDVDKDGDLDLYAVNWGVLNEMYINDGTGHFRLEDRGANGRVEDTNLFLRQGVTAADVDNDGDVDLYVCRFQRGSEPALNWLFINDGRGRFSEDAFARGVAVDGRSNGATFADFDNDGDMDLFVSNSQVEGNPPLLGVFINDGTGHFINKTLQYNIKNDGLSPIFLDVDNDGDQDLYLARSNAKTITNFNILYLNNNGNLVSAGGCGADVVAAKGRGTSVNDIDKDGDLDLYLVCEDGNNIFLANTTPTANNYLQIITVGHGGDLGGCGAKIDVYAAGHIGEAAYLLGHRERVSNYGYLCQNMPYEHFGLGSRTSCDVRITYTNGSKLERTGVVANQVIRLTNPYQLKMVSGNNQTTNPGEQLREPLVVKVTDRSGVGLANIYVTFVVVKGSGQFVESQPILTNENGEASCHFKLGPLVPEYIIEARCNEVQVGSPVPFQAYASGNAPARLLKISGDNQIGVTTKPLNDSIVVRVVNGYDIGVSGYPVRFTVTQGGGSINNGLTEVDVNTDTEGSAAVRWTIGAIAGTNNNKLQVTCLNAGAHLSGSPQQFQASGTSHTAIFLKKLSGDDQTGVVNIPLPASLVVEVRDAFHQLKAAAPVTFAVIQGNGRVNGATSTIVLSDQNGLVSANWILGKMVGVNTLRVTSNQDTTAYVLFSATSIPGPGRNMAAQGNTSFTGTAGVVLPNPLAVTVTDEFGNLVAGYPILFRVLSGGGHFNGQAEKILTTNGQGLTTIYFTPGQKVGINTVHAISDSLAGSPITFHVDGRAGNPAGIMIVSGTNQTGYSGARLPDPLVARVTDSFDNPIVNHLVQFKVTAGGATINGTSSIDQTTDGDGMVSVILTLGTVYGNNFVEASSRYSGSPLIGSPVTFRAFAKTEPQVCVRLSGDHQIGIANQPLTDSLRVQVLDASFRPLPKHLVQFRVIMGGGNFNGATDFNAYSNWDGIASAAPVLGLQTGYDRHKFQARSFNSIGQQLQNSPLDFVASARSSAARQLNEYSGSGQSGRTLSPLPEPFKVQVLDAGARPVANHDVTFLVIKGGGTMDATGKRELVKKTGADGIAGVVLTLGSAIGDSNNVVTVQSDDGLEPLHNSPVVFYASVTSGAIDFSLSEFSATSPVPADSTSQSEIIAKLVDFSKNPVRNVQVNFYASGSNNNLLQLSTHTDELGFVRGYLTSTRAEQKVIRAELPGERVWLPDSVVVDFIAGAPVSMQIVSGNYQTANIGTVLGQPLVVSLEDRFNNPVAGYPVNFSARSGDSRILTPAPILTSVDGTARAEVVASTIAGTNYFEATVQELGSLPKFEAMVLDHPPARLTVFSGNNQYACLGRLFENPIVVAIKDAGGLPVWNVPVVFNQVAGSCVLVGDNPDTSNIYGQAGMLIHADGNAGTNIIQALTAGVTDLAQFTLITAACGEMILDIISGNNQTANTESELPAPVIVRVTDEKGLPMERILVQFTAITPTASVITPQPVATDKNGLAQARLKLGLEPGKNVFSVEIFGQNAKETISAIAARPTFTRIVMYSGIDQSGPPSYLLRDPITVRIEDQDGKPVANQAVSFLVTSGGGYFTEAMPVFSDSNGIALAHWVLGPAGEQQARAQAEGLVGSPVIFRANLSNNRPPQVNTVTDTTITEMQALAFKVRGFDPDGDPFVFGAEDLPDGARFDSTGYQYFTWTPSYTQEGEYLVQFYARDDKDARGYARCLIKVTKKNRTPNILSFAPTNTTLETKYGNQLNFSIHAVDPDADPIKYLWKINQLAAGFQSSFSFIPNPSLPVDLIVTGLVFDQSDTASMRWRVIIDITAIELISFAAVSQERHGVLLTWETGRETNNAGFNILRSQAQSGRYEQVNTGLIPAKGPGCYEFHDRSISAGQRYYYKLADVSVAGQVTEHGPISVKIELPSRIALHQNYPNPFNPVTCILFELPATIYTKLQVFNLSGQMVRTLVDGELPGGYHSLTWDGKNDQGDVLPSAIYYYRLQAGDFMQTKKLMLLK